MTQGAIGGLLRILGIFLIIGALFSPTQAEYIAWQPIIGLTSISESSSSITGLGQESSPSGISSTKIISYTTSDENDALKSTITPLSIQQNQPPRWILDKKSGLYYDPISRTYWRLDPVLNRFYCEEKRWYLISRYSDSPPVRILDQFYYDPYSAMLIDMDTGDFINPNTMDVSQPNPSPIPTKIPKTSPTPTIIPPKPDQSSGGGSSSGTSSTDSCLVICSDCQEGYCHDCNQNQVCDERESITSDTETGSHSDTNSGGQSEAPQNQILPSPIVTSQSGGGQSEDPQVIPQPTKTPEPEGGISESAQGMILAMKAGSTWTNENTDAVTNNPKSPTLVTFNSDVHIMSLSTYHWNNGQGTSSVGTIGLKDSTGTIYGPWQATGEKGQGGVPNARWTAVPDADRSNRLTFKQGTYMVIDSDPETWSANAKSKEQGFCTVEYSFAIKTDPLKDLWNGSIQKPDLNGIPKRGFTS